MTVYLVDFENVRSTGLIGVENLNSDDKVIIFYSKNADSLTFDAHKLLNESQAKIETFMISKGGKNALDFQLSTYLGYLVMENKYQNIVIISNDKGFGFVTLFWEENKEKCKADIFLNTSINAHQENKPFVEDSEDEMTKNVQSLVGDKCEKRDVPLLVEIINKSKNKQELHQMLCKKLGAETGRNIYVEIKSTYEKLKKQKK